MSETVSYKKIPMWKLIKHKHILAHLESFHEKVFKCNFKMEYKKYGMGAPYVKEHAVPEYTPELRVVDLLDIDRISTNDTIILSDSQWNDYVTISQDQEVMNE